MKKTVWVLAFLFLTSCASKSVNLVSEPPSEVFIGSDFSEDYEKIGQTPVKIKLKDYSAKDKFAYLSFKAEGYQGQRVVLPAKYSSGSVEVKLEKLQDLKEIEERLKANFDTQLNALKQQMESQREEYFAKIEAEKRLFDEEKLRIKDEFSQDSLEIFNRVIEVQNALNLKKMAKAAKALAELRTYPAPESLLLTLEGNFEFINGRVRRALASYQRALDIDPGNVELEGVLRKLKRAAR